MATGKIYLCGNTNCSVEILILQECLPFKRSTMQIAEWVYCAVSDTAVCKDCQKDSKWIFWCDWCYMFAFQPKLGNCHGCGDIICPNPKCIMQKIPSECVSCTCYGCRTCGICWINKL